MGTELSTGDPPRGARRPRLGWWLLLAVLVLACALWYRHARPAPIVNVSPRHPETVGLGLGSFRGVHLGEATPAVVRTLGRPIRWGGFPEPTRATDDAIPPSGPGEAISLDYADMALDTTHGRVVWIVITSPRAQTSRGVGVGDSLAIARRAYPHLTCYAHDDGQDEPSGPPFCHVRMHPGLNLELIGDPILTVIVHGTRPAAA